MSGRRKPVPLTAKALTLVAGILLGWTITSPPALLANGGLMILSLGDDSYIPWSNVESRTGAVVRRELEDVHLAAFSVVALSNVSYTHLPEAVRDGLADYLARGGSLLVSGGKQSYGSGGYAGTVLADLLPLKPTRDDWLPHPFGPTLILQPDHPILGGVVIPTMAFFNEVDLNRGAQEIAQYRKGSKAAFADGGNPGGGAIEGGGRRPMPLIAEGRVGFGTVLAIALDMTLTGDWGDRNRFAQNCIEYLLQRSRIESITLPKEPVTK